MVEAHVPILAILLIAVMFGDTVACAIPIKPIKDDLDRLGCPPELQRVIPAVKALAVAGLTIGLWVPLVGAIASGGLVAYFSVALWYHFRIEDQLVRYLPATTLGVLAAVVGVSSYLPGI